MGDRVYHFDGRVRADAAPPTHFFSESGVVSCLHAGDIHTNTIEIKDSHQGTKPVNFDVVGVTLKLVSNSSRRAGSLVILEFTIETLLAFPVNESEILIFTDFNDAPASGTVALAAWANSTASYFGFEAGVRSTISTGVFMKPGTVVPANTEISFTGSYFAVGVA